MNFRRVPTAKTRAAATIFCPEEETISISIKRWRGAFCRPAKHEWIGEHRKEADMARGSKRE